jgi:hypothetical protein
MNDLLNLQNEMTLQVFLMRQPSKYLQENNMRR